MGYMRAQWGDEDAPPERRCCDCAICDGEDGMDMQIRKAASLEVHGTRRCAIREQSCDECREEMATISPQSLREDVGCELAGYSATAREWSRRYQHVDHGWLDPMDADMPLLEVAEIGDKVTSQADRDSIEASKD